MPPEIRSPATPPSVQMHNKADERGDVRTWARNADDRPNAEDRPVPRFRVKRWDNARTRIVARRA